MYDHIKGFRDFYPGEMRARREVMDSLEATARRYGFREVGTPALERAELYADKSGEEILEELYSFTDQGGREVALTPELTPTVARMVVAKQQELTKPIKWFSTRPFWRYEEPQQGRYREFYQTNVDVFGSSDPAADAEVLSFAADALTGLGLTSEDFVFRVSHRDILGGLLEAFEADLDVRAAIRAVDKREKVEPAEYYGLLADAGLSEAQAREFDDLLSVGEGDLDELVDFAGTDRVEDAVSNLRAVLETAATFGVREYCTLSLETARGLDYYTGVVFECFDSTGEVRRSVFGGGRYDDLIEGFGGPPTPAVGVAPGYAPLTLLCKRAGVWPAEALHTDYYVLQVGDTRPTAARVTRELRERGHVVETDVSGRSFGAQLDYADAIDAETVVIVGEQDLANDEVTVKEMDSGEQTQVPVDAFPGGRERPTYEDFAEGKVRLEAVPQTMDDELTKRIHNTLDASDEELEEDLPGILDDLEGQTDELVRDHPDLFGKIVRRMETMDIADFVSDNPDTADQFQELLWNGLHVLVEENPEIKKQIDSNITVNFEADDCPMTGHLEVDGDEQTIRGGAGHLDDPTITITGPANVLVGLITGNVDPIKGFMQRKYEMDGPVQQGTQLAPVMATLSENIPE